MVLLLLAASFLPPDTSLGDRLEAGVLKLCVPPSFPPLVTADPERPGYDVELAGAVARSLGIRLQVNALPSIGRDYNPRNWLLTRGQCDMVGGGVADSAQSRSFLQTIPTQARTGWIGISASGTMPDAGGTVAVLPGTSGLSRVALSTWLRGQQLQGRLVRDAEALATVLASGEADAAVTERFLASGLVLDPSRFQPFWLEGDAFASVPMALGLWKGDQTLKNAVETAIAALEQNGDLDRLRSVYGVNADLAFASP